MKIGILGAGNVGDALGGAWLHRRHQVMFGMREPESVKAGAETGSFHQAAQFGAVVVLALPWQVAHDILPTLDLKGKTVIDCTNPGRASIAGSGAEALQALAPEARIVKAFNMTGANNMKAPLYPEGPLAMFYCGDHSESKKVAHNLVADAGFEPFDLGPLSNAKLMESQAMLWIWLASQGGLGREFGFRLVRR